MRETAAQTLDFYRDLVQNLKAWQPPAPKLRSETADAPPDAGGADGAGVVPPWVGKSDSPAGPDTEGPPASEPDGFGSVPELPELPRFGKSPAED